MRLCLGKRRGCRLRMRVESLGAVRGDYTGRVGTVPSRLGLAVNWRTRCRVMASCGSAKTPIGRRRVGSCRSRGCVTGEPLTLLDSKRRRSQNSMRYERAATNCTRCLRDTWDRTSRALLNASANYSTVCTPQRCSAASGQQHLVCSIWPHAACLLGHSPLKHAFATGKG
jgi:hypothetical protein